MNTFFPVSMQLQRTMAEDTGAPELRRYAAFERKPYHRKGLLQKILMVRKRKVEECTDCNCCQTCAHCC